MTWFNENSKEIDQLAGLDIQSINTFTCAFFKFSFGKMKDVDKTSVLMKVQKMQDEDDYDMFGFIEYLLIRKIDFSLRFRPCGNKLSLNVRAFFVVHRIMLELYIVRIVNNILQ